MYVLWYLVEYPCIEGKTSNTAYPSNVFDVRGHRLFTKAEPSMGIADSHAGRLHYLLWHDMKSFEKRRQSSKVKFSLLSGPWINSSKRILPLSKWVWIRSAPFGLAMSFVSSVRRSLLSSWKGSPRSPITLVSLFTLSMNSLWLRSVCSWCLVFCVASLAWDTASY